MLDRRASRAAGREAWARSQKHINDPRIVAIVAVEWRWSRPFFYRGPGSIPHAVARLTHKLTEAPRA